MRYEKYSYLWPPRPENPFPPSRIAYYERIGHLAQFKKNGTCSVIFVSPEKQVIVKTRHNEDHKAWKYNPAVLRAFSSLPGNGWYVFVAELLHSKVSGIRDTFYIFEILVDDGEYLIGSTIPKRQERLKKLFLDGKMLTSTFSHWVLDEHTWLARTHENFSHFFNKNEKGEYIHLGPDDEGIVTKDPTARLEPCTRQTSNTGWQTKARRVTGRQNYQN